ncbi:serpin family protein [Streptomyces sp. NBC_00582]|uniref:serpin family protein n=1 Tax=Streptomyces sp. NBC_00582 TaxID=2975783 RepID=UPI0010638C9B|nr:serpin family protein [Streptomyces sp. NBC_00582]WUB62169.1 proteinase inhibitor I4 serpin [Streptomyces sp. NBC_00582]
MRAIPLVNGLTTRWAAADHPQGGSVFSAAGLWPLLAFLADGATGRAREELAGALGVAADQAAGAARELLGLMECVEGMEAALGLWTVRTVELAKAWVAGLPAGTHGVLTGDPSADRPALDAWAAERTGGRIARMPVRLDGDSSLVLATASALRTDWEVPFTGDIGVWTGERPSGEDVAGLHRTTTDLDAVGVARTPDGTVTEARVRGVNGLDVHLLLGEERMTRGQVLGAGVEIVGGGLPVVPGGRLPHGAAGPGLRVERQWVREPAPPSLVLTAVEFELTVEHDFLTHRDLFGLATATDGRPGHFAGISGAPLGLRSARQTATAAFSAEGFRATAVTATEAIWLSAEELPYETTVVRVAFDRPFGFLAVHRASGLVLTAGWVTEPKVWRVEDYGWPEEGDATPVVF